MGKNKDQPEQSWDYVSEEQGLYDDFDWSEDDPVGFKDHALDFVDQTLGTNMSNLWEKRAKALERHAEKKTSSESKKQALDELLDVAEQSVDNETEQSIQKLNKTLKELKDKGFDIAPFREQIRELKKKYETQDDKFKKELQRIREDAEKIDTTLIDTKSESGQDSPEEAFEAISEELESEKDEEDAGKFDKKELEKKIGKNAVRKLLEGGLLLDHTDKGPIQQGEVWVKGDLFSKYDSYREALSELQKDKEDKDKTQGTTNSTEDNSGEDKETNEASRDGGGAESKEQKEREKVKELFSTDAKMFVQGIDKAAYNKYGESDSEYGNPKELLENAESVAMSDAHGSALKILETAVTSELATMPEDSAKKLKKLYKEMVKLGSHKAIALGSDTDKDFSREDFKREFKEKREQVLELLEDIKWVGGDRELILIGDVLADRGLSDKITLKLIEKLRENGNVSACMSDHDWDLLARLSLVKASKAGVDLTKKEIQPCANDNQRLSLLRTVHLEEENDTDFIDNQENKVMYNDYWMNSDLFIFDEETSTLYTHANITSDHIEKIKKHLPSFNETTPINKNNISEFIEEANKWMRTKFKEVLDFENGKFDKESMLLIADLMWTREGGDYTNEEALPFSGIINNFVHGHGGVRGSWSGSEYRVDSREGVNENAENIDSKYSYNSTENKCNVFKLDDKHNKGPGASEISRQDNEFRLFVTTEEDRKNRQKRKAA